MKLVEWLLGKTEAPLPVIDDSFLGRLMWSAKDETWVGIHDGQQFALARSRGNSPTPDVLAYAKSVLADPSWIFGDFERERQKWKPRVPATAQCEVAALRIGLITFSMRKGRGFIYADVDGGSDDRCWRIMWLDRKCDGLGFDS